MNCLRWCLATLSATMLVGASPGEEVGLARTFPAGSVYVKKTRPMVFSYLVHPGPYWTLGQTFSQVREYMQENGIEGPLVVRSSADLNDGRADPRRAEVGFLNEGSSPVTAPFRRKTLESELAAITYVDPPVTSPFRYVRALADWASERGFVAMNILTEIHPPDRQSRLRGQHEAQVELRLALEPADAWYDGQERSEQADLSQDQRLRSSEPRRHEEPPVTRRAMSGAETTTDEDSLRVGWEAPPAARSDTPPIESAGTHTISLTDLASAERFDDVAAMVVSDAVSPDPNIQNWLGHLILRTKAVARGIAKTHPGAPSPVGPLAEDLERRYRDVFGRGLPTDAPIWTGRTDDSHAQARREILQGLDALLGLISWERVTPSEAFDRLLAVFEIVIALERPESSRYRPNESNYLRDK